MTLLTNRGDHVLLERSYLERGWVDHAYAVTVHRAQGSEYPCVVIPITTSAWMMLQRNLLYTAVTRAKRIVVLVGSKRALAKAVRTQGAGRRYTALTDAEPWAKAGVVVKRALPA